MERVVRLLERLAASPVKGPTAVYAAVFIVLLILASAWLVHAMGGIRYVFSHSIYLPIVLAAFLFGAPGGITAGIAAGLVLGPYMPINTDTGEMQSTLNWTYRLLFFVLIGCVTGILASRLRQHVHRMEWLSLHDPETGIANSRALFAEVNRAIARSRSHDSFRLYVIDLRNYLDITSTLGPEIGAKLIRAVAARLRSLLDPSVVVCSIHTQRLGFIAPDRNGPVDIRRLYSALQEPYPVHDIPIYVDTAIGSAVFPIHADSPDRLLQKAMIAMHSAVQRGTAHIAYDIASDRTSREALELLGELSEAMKGGQLRLFYQPKVNLRTSRIEGVEALLRWQHPRRGWVSPGSFIPYVENSTLVHVLSIWVFQQAVEQLLAWRNTGIELHIAINVSMRNLEESTVVEAIERILSDRSFPNRLIEIEVTESALLLDPALAVKLFERWRKRGATIAVDDFGTGHASLAYIRDLPVDVLKIDQTFIRSLRKNDRDHVIVRAAIALASDLNLQTVAEGVEDRSTIVYLRNLGCDCAQGYAIQRPLPADELGRWFEQTHEFTLRRSPSHREN